MSEFRVDMRRFYSISFNQRDNLDIASIIFCNFDELK